MAASIDGSNIGSGAAADGAGGAGGAGVVSGIGAAGAMLDAVTGTVDLSEQPMVAAIPLSDNRPTNLRRVNIRALDGWGKYPRQNAFIR